MDETVGHVIFGRGGNSDSLIGIGWSAAESDYRWMVDDISEFWLTAPSQCALVLALDVHPHVGLRVCPTQRVIIKTSGLEVYRTELSEPTVLHVHIPPMDAVKLLHVTIEHPDAITPRELAGQDDERRLAVAIREARLYTVNEVLNNAMPGVELFALPVVVEPARLSTVFVGNCQMGALCSLYRRLLPPESDHQVSYIESYKDATEEGRRVIAQATAVVQQVLNFVPRIGELATKAKVYLVPHASAAFLWPHGGSPHPLNRAEPAVERSGPYNAELGDNFLNRLISAGTSPPVALAKYLAATDLIVARAERMRELHLQSQRERDAVCDIHIADRIESLLQSVPIFRSANHPEPAILSWIAKEVFARMGENPAAIARLLGTHPDALPATETPIHPAVVQHFGLTYAPPARRYRYFEEGAFTFVEYVGRYMRYEWSAPLAVQLSLLRQQPSDAAIAALASVLPTAPRSAIGRMALAEALARIGRLEDAIEYAFQAVTIEPSNNHCMKFLVHLSDRLSPQAQTEITHGPSPVLS